MYHWEEMLITSIKCNQHGQVGQLELKKNIGMHQVLLYTLLYYKISIVQLQYKNVDKISSDNIAVQSFRLFLNCFPLTGGNIKFQTD
jgi:hypothetical protein